MELPEILSVSDINDFFVSLTANLNQECYGKTDNDYYPMNCCWTVENFTPRGRKFDINSKGCLDIYDNMCPTCYTIIVKAREEFKELYNDGLENQVRLLMYEVNLLKNP